jgi:hypothetical protein
MFGGLLALPAENLKRGLSVRGTPTFGIRSTLLPTKPPQKSSRFRFSIAGSAALSLGLFSLGCGSAVYGARANSAESKLEEARELGAERLAPFEYYMAREHLDKARSEAAEADYGDAIDLAAASEEYANQAILSARAAHRGAGR